MKELLIRDCLYPALKESIDEFTDVSRKGASIRRIVDEFKHSEEDATQWLTSCRSGRLTANAVLFPLSVI